MIKQQSLLHSNKYNSVEEKNTESNQKQLLDCKQQCIQQKDNILEVKGKITGKILTTTWP